MCARKKYFHVIEDLDIFMNRLHVIIKRLIYEWPVQYVFHKAASGGCTLF